MRQQASSVTLPDAYANYVHYGPPGRMGAQTPMMQQQQQQLGRDHILPAVLEFREETEETFFSEIIAGLDVNTVQFKLAPTYTLYMATRYLHCFAFDYNLKNVKFLVGFPLILLFRH